jgi:hypothetical protein
MGNSLSSTFLGFFLPFPPRGFLTSWPQMLNQLIIPDQNPNASPISKKGWQRSGSSKGLGVRGKTRRAGAPARSRGHLPVAKDQGSGKKVGWAPPTCNWPGVRLQGPEIMFYELLRNL